MHVKVKFTTKSENLYLTAVYLFEIATASLLPVHHVMEDGDHDIPQIRLRHQRHLQERTNHRRDEVQLVLPWRRERERERSKQRLGSHFIPEHSVLFVSEAIWPTLESSLPLFENFSYNTGCSDNWV